MGVVRWCREQQAVDSAARGGIGCGQVVLAGRMCEPYKIAEVQPELFCKEVSLCELVSNPVQKRDDACMICQSLLSQVLMKLQDLDTELDVIRTLLKVCNKVENFVQERSFSRQRISVLLCTYLQSHTRNYQHWGSPFCLSLYRWKETCKHQVKCK